MMRRVGMAAVICLMAGAAAAGDTLTLQLQGPAGAQFAGYHVALAKGFYAAENLDVTIRPGRPGIAPMQVLAEGGADVAVDWMPAALVAREKGLPVVNIAQPFKASSLRIVCLRESGVSDLRRDLPGSILGVRFDGSEHAVLGWLNALGLGAQGGPEGVTLRPQETAADALRRKQVGCATAATHGEAQQLAEGPAPAVTIFAPPEGSATLEDGLYALAPTLADPAMADRMARFVRASMKGWRHVEAQPDEAAALLPAPEGAGAADSRTQRQRIDEVIRLISGSSGALDPEDAARTVETLMRGGPQAVIHGAPDGAWTHAMTDKALH